MKILPFLTVLVLIISACKSSPTLSSSLPGHWLMHKVIQNGQDVSQEHNPEKERYLVMRPDGSFESGGRPYGKNTGKYTFDANDQILFLDSDVGETDDSKWRVEINGDTMYWQGIGNDYAEAFQIIQIRKRQ